MGVNIQEELALRALQEQYESLGTASALKSSFPKNVSKNEYEATEINFNKDIEEKDQLTPELTEESIKDWNYAELVKEISNQNKMYDTLKSQREMITEYRNMYGEMYQMNRMVNDLKEKAVQDGFDSGEFDRVLYDLSAFERSIEPNLQIMTNNLTLLNDRLVELYGSDKKKTKFITDQMLISVNKYITRLTMKMDENHEFNIPREPEEYTSAMRLQLEKLYIEKEALEARATQAFMYQRMTSIMQHRTVYNEVIRDYDRADRQIHRYLNIYFNNSDIKRFRIFFTMLTDPFTARLILFHISKVIRYGRSNGTSFYGRVFLMNILDYAYGAWDLTSEDEFLAFYSGIAKRYRNVINDKNYKSYYKTNAYKRDTDLVTKVAALQKAAEERATETISANATN